MSLTPEQQLALDQLMAQVPSARQPVTPDWLQTWLGVSRQDVKQWLSNLVADKNGLEQRLLTWAEQNPFDAIFEFIAAASAAFYLAEKTANPRIRTYVDAFYYIATCASVGYADIFAVTQTGRSIAALVMLVGPALTDRMLNRPAAKENPAGAIK